MKPLAYHADGSPHPLRDRHAGASCFLIGGGPSFVHDHRLDGLLTMAMNHHGPRGVTYRVMMDPPKHFPAECFGANGETSFVPIRYREDARPDGVLLRDSPNTLFYFVQPRHADPARFFDDKRLDIGDDPEFNSPGVRSVMFPALRLLQRMGVSTIYLLGVDFNKSPEGDPHYFEKLRWKLYQLAPALADAGLTIFNCNPDSYLDVFPAITLEDAITAAAGNGCPSVTFNA